MKPATTADHRRFCEVDEWQRTADQPGRRVKKHEVWVKNLADGTRLRTAISKGKRQYGRQMFSRICRQQLAVTERQFWDAVQNGVKPERPEDTHTKPTERRLPLEAHMHLRGLGYSDVEIRAMGPNEALRRLEELQNG